MAEIKTKATDASVEDFLLQVKDEQQRKDSMVVADMMKKATGQDPKMWGSSLIGFGQLRYKSPKTGREVDWFIMGFSPRKANLSLHLAINIHQFEADLKKLGKHKTGAGCLYINKLSDVDLQVLEKLITKAANPSI